jgi:uncharacterized protein (TIGR03435 family)
VRALTAPENPRGRGDGGLGRFSFQVGNHGRTARGGATPTVITHAVDYTGLTGTYDAKLMFAGGQAAAAENVSEPAPDMFNALERQLGLKLQKTAAPLDVIVIDHIDRTPVEN